MGKKETYSVVVETGSCSPDYQRWEEKEHCGHNHRTIDTAIKCMEKLTAMYCQHGIKAGKRCHQCLGGIARGQNTSATWYGARIHNQNQERVMIYD